MSAGMNTVAGTLYEDLFTYVLKGKKQSQAQQSFMIKIITVIIGLICISLVFVVERLGAIFQMAISLHGVTGGSLVGIFIMGVFFPRANPKSVKYGALTSLVAMCGLVFATQYYVAKGLLKFPGKITSVDGCPANLTATLGFNASTLVQTYKGIGSPTVADDSVPSIFKLSYLYYTMVGTMIVLLVGLPISYFSPAPDPASLDPRLFTPFIRPYLPRPEIIKPPHEEYTLVSNVEPSSKDSKENETST